MGLFTPAWNSKNPEKRMKAVKEITDVAKLQKIAERTQYEDVRRETWKLIAINGYSNVALQAVEKITDQKILAEIAKTDEDNFEDRSIRELATEKITDQNILAEIVKTSKCYFVRKKAVEKIKMAVKNITDQNILAEIAKTDKNIDVRKAAIDRIYDQNILSKIARTAEYSDVRKAAIERITEQNVVIEIAKTDKNIDVRKAAIDRIIDQNILADFMNNDSEKKVKSIAKERLFEVFSEMNISNILPETIEIVIKELDSNINESVLWKIIDIAKINPTVLKPFFTKIKTELNKMHFDYKLHDDVTIYKESSSDCHSDYQIHTDKQGKAYLAQFPPFFND